MVGKNRTGTAGQGQGTGRGSGGGQPLGEGPGGNCICPECGIKKTHQRGLPCFNMKCPECGASMIRETR